MFYTYVAQSIEDSNYQYKGHCENMETRLREHNSGNTKSNKHKAPFKIIYFEESETREEAIRKEKYWKTAAGRRYLHKKIAVS
jgi:putative endonuclease